MNSDKKKVLEEYVVFRRLKNHSQTINDIENHIRWFMESSKVPLSEFNEKILLNYLDKIKDKYSVGMLNAIKSSYLKNFIKWHFRDWSDRFVHLDTICKMEKTKSAYQPDDMISEEEFKKLMKGEESFFWKAYFMTLFYGGCRPTEVCNLKWGKVEFTTDGAFITIYSEKNKKEFIKFVPHDVSFFLEKLKDNGSEYVFWENRYKAPVTVKGAYRHIRKLSQKALGYKIDLYTLRHSIATIIYNKEGMKDDDIANQMGHNKSMRNTYVHNNKERLKALAKNIYVSPEDLPQEKKHKLELEIEKLKKENSEFKVFSETFSKFIDKNGDMKKSLMEGLVKQVVSELKTEIK